MRAESSIKVGFQQNGGKIVQFAVCSNERFTPYYYCSAPVYSRDVERATSSHMAFLLTRLQTTLQLLQ
jgi:hypothetical protein